MTKSNRAKKANLLGRLEAPTGRFWTQSIEPKGAALLSQTLGRCYFVIKNHGPGNIRLVAGHGDLMDIRAGDVRATYACGTITVENGDDKSVLIEFDFIPIYLKP